MSEPVPFHAYPEDVKSKCLKCWAAYNKQKRTKRTEDMGVYLRAQKAFLESCDKHSVSFGEVDYAFRHR